MATKKHDVRHLPDVEEETRFILTGHGLDMSNLSPSEAQRLRDILQRAAARRYSETARSHRRRDPDDDGNRSGRTNNDDDTSDDSRRRHTSTSGTSTADEPPSPGLPAPPKQSDLHLPRDFVEIPRQTTKKQHENAAPPQMPQTPEANSGPLRQPVYAVPTRNSFEALDTSVTMDVETAAATSQKGPPATKPPPLVVYNTSNYQKLNGDIKSVISGSLRAVYLGDHVKYLFETMSDYQRATAFIEEHQMQYFTHQAPHDRLLKVVIRRLPEEIPVQDIYDALTAKGYQIRNIHRYNRRDRQTGNLIPMPTVVISLPKGQQSDKIFKERYLLDTRVYVKNYEPKDGPLQCTNCQRLRHTARYCHMPPRCVKCAGSHATADCKLTPTEKATCALCGTVGHPASWKGCPVYQKALKQFPLTETRFRRTTSRRSAPPPSSPPATTGEGVDTAHSMGRSSSRTYASALSGRPTRHRDSSPLSLGDSLNQIKDFLMSLFRPEIVQTIQETAVKIQTVPDTFGKLLAFIEGLVKLFR